MTHQPSTDPQDLTGLIEPEKLRAFLAQQLPGDDGAPLQIRRHEAGYSNETFFLTRGDRHWVMRRPPRGELLPTSHDVPREFRVLSGLYGTAARVPKPLLACVDTSVIGAPFYIMERVDGVVIREELPDCLDAQPERRRIGEEMIDALAELHGVDWEAAGLANLGRPQGYLERQVRRWNGQLELTLPRTRPLPGIAEVSEWLKTQLPDAAGAAVVHGDYKLDNVVFAGQAPARLDAILDWEMATLGDPLADVGWLLCQWGPTGVQALDEEPGAAEITSRPGFLSRAEMVARYEERTGRRVRHVQFYVCLAVWKLAIILEGLYAGYLEGTAANPRSVEHGVRVPLLVERMHRIMGGEI